MNVIKNVASRYKSASVVQGPPCAHLIPLLLSGVEGLLDPLHLLLQAFDDRGRGGSQGAALLGRDLVTRPRGLLLLFLLRDHERRRPQGGRQEVRLRPRTRRGLRARGGVRVVPPPNPAGVLPEVLLDGVPRAPRRPQVVVRSWKKMTKMSQYSYYRKMTKMSQSIFAS